MFFIRRDLLILLLACTAVFFTGLGASGLVDPGDGYYTEGAREMVERGDYVVPHLNYQIYFSKPILIFWLIAAAYKIFGTNEFAGRFWSALSATILALVVYVLTRQLANRRAALVASLIFIASPLVITFARMAMIDMILSALLGAAVWAFINAVLFEKRHWWILLYVALALGLLIKGPIAPLLFLLSISVYLLVTRPEVAELKKTMRLLHPFAGGALFMLIIAPWCIAVSIATKGLFLKVFLWFENVRRFLGHVNHKHMEPWFYIPVIIYGFFPWAICLPAALNDALKRRLIAPAAKDRLIAIAAKDSPEYDRERAAQCNAVLFLACFSLCVLVFFSLARAKVETYILPCWSAFAVLTGIWLASAVDSATGESALKPPRSFSFLSGICLACAVVAIAVSLYAFAAMQNQNSPLINVLAPETNALAREANVLARVTDIANHVLTVVSPAQKLLVLAGVLLLCGGWIYQWYLSRLSKLPECLVSMVLSAVLAAALLTPVAARLIYELKAADLEAVAIEGRGLKLAIFQEFKPSLMFYTRQPIDSFFAPGQLVPTGESKPQYVIASDRSIPALQAVHGKRFKLMYKRGNWGLYLAQGLTLMHLPSLEQTFRQDLNLSVGNYHWGTLPFASGE